MTNADPIDLGLDHALEFVHRDYSTFKSHAVGAMVSHPNAKEPGKRCGSYIGLDPELNTAPATWQVESWDPLTLSPSLLCMVCGDHGFIREGKWIPA